MHRLRVDRVEVIAWISFALSMIIFLNATRPTGEALENLDIIISTGAVALMSGAIAVTAAVIIFLLHFLPIDEE